MASDPSSTTRLLNRYGRGERDIEPELIEAIYAELYQLARGNMQGQRSDHTLQATALVNEAWMRIQRQAQLEFDGRSQFYALASRVMRSVLVDHSRRAQRDKRGGGRTQLSLSIDDTPQVADGSEPGSSVVDMLALEEALERLEEADAHLCRLVELRFFGGLKHEEIAGVLGVSTRTVERQWRAAKAFLVSELTPE